MDYLARTSSTATSLARKKFVGLSMLSLLCLETVNQGLAHNSSGGALPATSAPPTARVRDSLTGVTWGTGGRIIDIGTSHGSVPLVPHATKNSNSLGAFSAGLAGHKSNATSGLTLVVPAAGAYTAEIGQSGHKLALDLTSTAADIVLGSKLFGKAPSVTINVGGRQETFKAGSQVTAGQYVAIQQVLGGGGQGVSLSHDGAATGGTFSLNAVDKGNVTSLTVPTSVTALDYVNKNGTLTLNGALTNYGSIDAISTNSKLTSGTISASDITNEAGATISSVVPSSLGSSTGGLAPNVSLTLEAGKNISNAGSITSSNALTLNAASGAITNTPGAAVRAVHNVTLNAGSGNFENAGLVLSQKGNINVAAQNAVDININGMGGTFQAKVGNISVRDASYGGDNNINLAGGNYLSKNLDLNGGSGAITGNVGEVSGNLNTAGNAAHFAADTANLVLGANTISGDPTFVSSGNITIDGHLSAAQQLTLLAGGNITVQSGSDSSITTNNSSSGIAGAPPATDITLVAGASVSLSSGSPGSSLLLPGDSPILTGVTATLFSGTNAGGNIDLTGGTHGGAIIDTSSTLTNGNGNQVNGGNVILAACGNGAGGGQILLPAGSGASINTSSTTGNGGNVTIISGNQTVPTSISVAGTIVTAGSSTGSGGTVNLYTQQPGSSTPAVQPQVTFDSTGANTGGNTIGPGGAVFARAIQTSGINTGSGATGGNINITAGSYADASGLTTSGTASSGSVNINAIGTVQTSGITTSSSTGLAGAINIVGNAYTDNNAAGLNASGAIGGNVNIRTTGSGLPNIISVPQINASATGGNGGTVSILAEANVFVGPINTSSSAAGASSGNGGDVTILGNQITVGSSINTSAVGNTANAGSLTIAAVAVLAVNGDITTTAAGFGGNVSLSAGDSITTYAINTSSNNGSTNSFNSGNVAIQSTGGSVTTGNITTLTGTFGSFSFMGNGGGGNVAIAAATSINTGTIDTDTNYTNGNSGSVVLSAGTTITTNNILTFSQYGFNCGEVALTAAGAISTGNIATYNLDAANGNAGVVVIVSGSTVNTGTIQANSGIPTFGNGNSYGLGNAGNISIQAKSNVTTGDINASFNTGDIPGSSGNVVVVSTGGSITIGSVGSSSASIDTSTDAFWVNHSGSVSLVAAKSIDVLNGINTDSVNYTAPSIAGNVFVSSGTAVSVGNIDASAAAGGTAGSIFLGANVTGNNGPSATGTGQIQFALVNSQSVGAQNPYLFFNTNTTSLPGTVSVIYSSSPTSVNINPGVYTAIGSTNAPAALTLNLGGDSRTLVPIAASGDIFVSSVNANNSGAFSNSVSSLNGYNVYLVSAGTTGITITGNITANPLAGGLQGDVNLAAVGAGAIAQTAGNSIFGGNLSLLAAGGNIGLVAAPIQTSVNNIFAATSGSGSVYIVNNANTSVNLALAGVSGGTFSLVSNDNLAVFGPMVGSAIVLNSSGSANVGTEGMPIQTLAANLTVSSAAPSNFFFNNAGSLNLNSSTVSGNLFVTVSGNLTTSGAVAVSSGLLGLSAAGSIEAASSLASTASAIANPSGIHITAGNTIITLALTTTGTGNGNGGDIIVIAPNGIATGAIDTSASGNGNGGSVILGTGNIANNAALSTGALTTSGQNGGLVELVNSAATTSANNLTVAGNITSNALAAAGVAGPIALVASGGISAVSISAQDTAASGTGALGGGVFISSGGTGSTAVSVTSINTSAPTSGSNNTAGNVIIITSAATSGATPSNIAPVTPTQNGNHTGSSLIYGLDNADAPSTIPAQLNVTTVTPGGSSGINIHPGGYQTTQGLPGAGDGVNLVVDTNDRQMLAPINIGATGTSLFLNSVTQKNGNDNVNLILSGDLTTTGAISTSTLGTNNSSVEILANGSINLGGSLTLASSRTIDLAALGTGGIGGPAQTILMTTSGNLNVLANINTSTAVGSGGQVSLTSGQTLAVGNIYTSSTDTADTTATGGNVSLSAGSVVVGNIYTPANSSSGNGGAVVISASAGSLSTGDIETSDQQYYLGNAGPVTLSAADSVNTGAIYTPSGYANEGGAISVTAGTSIYTDDITSGTNMIGGTTDLTAGTSITTGNVFVYGNSSGGGLTITGGSDVSIGNVVGGSPAVPSINISSTGGSVTADTISSIGSPISVTAQNNISTQDIETNSLTTTGLQNDPSTANGGSVNLSSATGSVSINGGIYTFVTSAPSAISGGGVSISGISASIGNGIFTGATSGSAAGASSGDISVTSASGLLNVGPINSSAVTGANSGTVTLSASGASGAPVTSAGINAGSQTVSISGTALTNESGSTISGGTITVSGVGAPGSSFVFTNNGTVTANNGNIAVASAAGQGLDLAGTGTFTVSGSGTPSINFTATDSANTHPDLVFLAGSNQAVQGVTNLNANGSTSQAVIAQNAALAAGTTTVNVNSTQLLFQGTGTITGTPLVLNSGGNATIANSSGDVNLSSNLTFLGDNLAILAFGNINTTGASSLNLSNNGNGGSLVLVAGYSFTPTTHGGQAGPDNTIYTLDNVNTSAGGSINLGGWNVNTSSNTGNAGSILAVANGGSITIGSVTSTSNAAGAGTGGLVTLLGQYGVSAGLINTSANTGGNVAITAAAPIAAANTVIGGGIVIGGGFSAPATPIATGANIAVNGINTISTNSLGSGTSGTVTLNTGGTGSIYAATPSSVSAGKVSLTSGSSGIGTSILNFIVNSPTVSANSTGSVYLTDAYSDTNSNQIVLNGSSSGAIFSLITTGVSTTVVGGTGTVTTPSLVLLSTNGGSFGTALPTQVINTNASNLALNAGTGSVYISNAAHTGNLSLMNVIGNDVSITSGGQITTTQNITATGLLSLTATGLVNAYSISASAIEISAVNNQVLSIVNTGTITATSGNIQIDSAMDKNVLIGNDGTLTNVGSCNVSGSNSIIMNANASGSGSSNDIIFTGGQNLSTGPSGQTTMNASTGAGQAVVVDGSTNFATVAGNNKVVVNSLNLSEANGTLIGNSLVFNSVGAGTITSNTNLDLGLSSSLIFHGENLTIISSGNITSSAATTIDLSGTSASVNSGNGGNLTLLAGYTFTGTSNQNPAQGTFVIAGPSSGGGNIYLSNVNINTSSTVQNGSGGSVLVVASGPNGTSGGTIALGTVNTSANVAGSTGVHGGGVTIIGQGITTGTIGTTSTDSAGSISVLSANPTTTGSPQSINGNFFGGSFSAGATFSGNIATGAITAGAASITLQTGGTGNIQLSNVTTTGTVNLTLATGGTGLISTTGTSTIDAGLLNLSVSSGTAGTSTQGLNANASTITALGTANSGSSVYLNDSLAAVQIGQANPLPGVSIDTFSLTNNTAGSIITVGANGTILGSNSWIINSAGTITFANAIAITPNVVTGKGGSLSLTGAAINFSTAFNDPFNANGNTVVGSTPLGAGGSIAINITGTSSTPPAIATLGSGIGDFTLSAAGVNGGSVSFTTAGPLSIITDSSGNIQSSTINVAPTASGTNQGSGGGIALSAGSISWGTAGSGNSTALNLTSNGIGTGSGGSVAVSLTGAQTTANIGQSAGDFNLTATGPGGGGSASFTTTGALSVLTDSSGNANFVPSLSSPSNYGLNVAPATSGYGGSITLSAGSITGNPSGKSFNFNVDGIGTASSGGSVSVSITGASPGTATIGTNSGNFNFMAAGGSNTGNGGSVAFSTTGALVVNAGSINIATGPSGGNGGIIALTGSTIANGGTGALVLTANGVNNGLGGFISIDQTSNANAVIGSGAGAFTLNAAGGNNSSTSFNNGNGSGVSFISGGLLAVTASAIDVAASIGASGENVSLSSASAKTVFTIAGSTTKVTNGVMGTINVLKGGSLVGPSDGTLTFINTTGGVTNSVALTGINGLTIKAGGTGSVVIGKTITTDLNANSFVDLTNAGTGSISGSQIVTTTNLNLLTGSGSIGALTVVANNVGAVSGGAVTITDKLAGTGTAGTAFIANSSSGQAKAFSFTDTAGNIDTTGNITAGTSLVLKASATTAANGGIALGNNSVLNASGTGGVVTLTATGTTAAGGAGNISAGTGADISATKTVTLSAAKGSIQVESIGLNKTPTTATLTALNNITNDGAVKATTTVTEKQTGTTNTSGININGNILASGATTGVVSLTAAGGAGIVALTTGAGSDISGGKSVTLSATKGIVTVDNIGIAQISGIVKVTSLDALTEAGAIIAGSSTALSTTATAASNAGSITVNNISTGSMGGTGGAITVIASGGALQVDGLAKILSNSTSNKSAITLQNKNAPASGTAGTLMIGGGANIITTAGSTGGGNVNLLIGTGGATTTTLPQNGGSTGLTFNPNPQPTKPVFFFGTPNGATFSGGTNSLISVNSIGGGKVTFNAGKAPQANLVIVGGGSTAASATIITADPPVGSGTPSTAAVAQGKAELVNALALADTQPPANSNSAAVSAPQVSSLSSPAGAAAFGNLSALSNIGATSASVGSLQSSIVEGTASTTATSANRTLYGAATECAVPEDTMYVGCNASQIGQIEAAVVGSTEMGIVGPNNKDIEMSGWTSADSQVMTLRKGNVIVAPDQDMTVQTAFGQVQVGARSMVLIIALPTGTAFFNLDDTRKNSVVISIGKNQMTLSPGRHAMVTSHLVEGYEMVNPAESFGYRNVSSKKLDGDLQAFTSEFSMANVIGNVKQLKALVNSKHPEAKRMTNHLLKTAAIVNQLSGQGQYEQYQHPRMTATALIK